MTRLWPALFALMLIPPAASQTSADDCQCLWAGSFSEVAAQADLVLQGEALRTKGNAVDFRPIEQYHGINDLDSIRVWMKTGNYCRPTVEQFPAGSRWVLALQQIRELPDDGFNPHTPNHSYGRPFDYRLSACGGFWLAVRGQSVIGNLVPGTPRWDHAPDMTPVRIDLVAAFIAGNASVDDLREASEEDPALRELMLDTRSFLRGQDEYLEEDVP